MTRDNKFLVIMCLYVVGMVIAIALLARGCNSKAEASADYRPFNVFPVKYGNYCFVVFTAGDGGPHVGHNLAAVRVPCQAKLQLLSEEGPL